MPILLWYIFYVNRSMQTKVDYVATYKIYIFWSCKVFSTHISDFTCCISCRGLIPHPAYAVQWLGVGEGSSCVLLGVFLVNGDVLLDIIRGTEHNRSPLVDGLRLDVQHIRGSCGGHSSSLLHNEGHGVAFIKQPQLNNRQRISQVHGHQFRHVHYYSKQKSLYQANLREQRSLLYILKSFVYQWSPLELRQNWQEEQAKILRFNDSTRH